MDCGYIRSLGVISAAVENERPEAARVSEDALLLYISKHWKSQQAPTQSATSFRRESRNAPADDRKPGIL